MKTIQQLIDEGYEAKRKCLKINNMLKKEYISGEEYENWLAYCTRYLEQYYPNDKQTLQFIEVSKEKSLDSIAQFNKLISVLKAIMEIPPVSKCDDMDIVLEKICTNFHKCAKSIQDRHDNRSTIEINDEYDMQDLLQGILRLFFADVRPEDYIPSYAGGNSRIDFYLPQYETYIETKMTRDGLKDNKLGEELTIDIARYREKGKKLVCLVYDKCNLLKNPYGLIKDLESNNSESFNVKVYISPL